MNQISSIYKLFRPAWLLTLLILVALFAIGGQQATLRADEPPADEQPDIDRDQRVYLPVVAVNSNHITANSSTGDTPTETVLASITQAIVTGPVLGSDTSTLLNPAQYGKPSQTRIWYNSSKGRWDAIVPKRDPDNTSDVYILKDVPGSQTFTTVELEDRNLGRPDLFWDDGNRKLYVFSSHPTGPSEFWRLGYDLNADSYNLEVGALGAGVAVPGITHPNTSIGGDSPATLYISPNGRAWVAVLKTTTLITQPLGLQIQSSSNGGSTWLAAPLTLDAAAKLGVTTWTHFTHAGQTYVGIFAAENGESGTTTRFYFWYINQAADPTVLANWVNDSASLGPVGAEQSDDHVSAARDQNGNLYFAVKTESGNGPDPLIKLFKRTSAGQWSWYTVTKTSETPEQSRPSIVIDDDNHELSIYTNGSEIVSSTVRAAGRKRASLNNLEGLATTPLVILFSKPDTLFSDVITPRHNVNIASGIVVLAHNRTEKMIWYSAESMQPVVATPTPTATATPLPTATDTPTPAATDTPAPTATSTLIPTATDTPLPTATNTPLPTATDTPASTATNTPMPTATNTPLPTATPQTIISYVNQDNWLKEQAPNDNFGSNAELLVQEKRGDAARSIYRFNLSQVPLGATIQSATVYFWVTQKSNSPVNLHRITDAWTESGANWRNTAADFDPVADGSFTPSSSDRFVSANFTALVQEWASGISPNHGVMLISTGRERESKYTSRSWNSANRRPYLRVTFVSGVTAASAMVDAVDESVDLPTVNTLYLPVVIREE